MKIDKDLFIPSGVFLESTPDYKKAAGVIFGMPMDSTVSYKPGSRFGPNAIRQASYAVEEFSFSQRSSLFDIHYADLGDLELPLGHVEDALALIYKVASQIMAHNKVPFGLGGEHLVSWPLIKAAADHYGKELVVLHFDAHADLRAAYGGRKLSHATVMRQVANYVALEHIYQFGIRSGTVEELQFAKENVNFYPFDIFPHLPLVLEKIKGSPVYVTIDIDIVDPAFAPGTGTPEPGGITSRDILETVRLLRGQKVVGLDLVEVSPIHDPANITAVLGAKLLREAMLAVLNAPQTVI